jgi:hypothetical protein
MPIREPVRVCWDIGFGKNDDFCAISARFGNKVARFVQGGFFVQKNRRSLNCRGFEFRARVCHSKSPDLTNSFYHGGCPFDTIPYA